MRTEIANIVRSIGKFCVGALIDNAIRVIANFMTAPYFHSIFSGSIFHEIRIGMHVMTAPYEPNNENLVRFSNKIRNAVPYFAK